MLKILVRKWDKNKDKLQHELSTRESLKLYEYKDLVKLTFEVIYNVGEIWKHSQLDLYRMTEIDNGDDQGTLLYLIPFDSYQPSEYDYLMTYVGYGSCSGCDTLKNIRGEFPNDDKLTESQVKDFMKLCKDILTNTIKPYNNGWRNDEDFEHSKEK